MGALKTLSDGSVGLPGSQQDEGGFLSANCEYLAASVSKVFHVASRPGIVRKITVRVEVAGTDGSAVTATIVKVPSGTAVASGTALHASTANLKGTAATNQVLTLSTTAATLRLAAGDALGIKFAGVLTAATGVASVQWSPA